MLKLTKNEQGRYDLSIPDRGFYKGNEGIDRITGVRAYDSCIGRIIGRILSLFGLTVRMELDSLDPSKKAYVWVSVSSIKNLVERNTDQGITNKSIECPKSFNSETVEKLVLDVKAYKEKKVNAEKEERKKRDQIEQETWILSIEYTSDYQCPDRKLFFDLARSDVSPELKDLKEDLKKLWSCTKAFHAPLRFQELESPYESEGYSFKFVESYSSGYGTELKYIKCVPNFFRTFEKLSDNQKKEALKDFHRVAKIAIKSYKS